MYVREHALKYCSLLTTTGAPQAHESANYAHDNIPLYLNFYWTTPGSSSTNRITRIRREIEQATTRALLVTIAMSLWEHTRHHCGPPERTGAPTQYLPWPEGIHNG